MDTYPNSWQTNPGMSTGGSPEPPVRYQLHPSENAPQDAASQISSGGDQPVSQQAEAASSESWKTQDAQQTIWNVDRQRQSSATNAFPKQPPSEPAAFKPFGSAATQSPQQMPYVAGSYARAQATQAAQAAPKHSNGKVFLAGFGGALAAFMLCMGLFAAWLGMSGQLAAQPSRVNISADNGGASITIGATEPTIIDAEDEDATLAERVAAKALPSVVYIGVYASSSYYGYGSGHSSDLSQVSLGSGIVLTDDGYILTNNHVVSGAEALTVNAGGVEYEAEVVGTDPSSDLAVIKAKNASGLVPADLGDSDSLAVGEWVMSIGSPFGLEQSVATGVVSATSRSTIMDNQSYYGNSGEATPTLYVNLIQTDAAINPGNSGGALVDSDGKVVGVNTLISSYSGSYSGVGFAIPINYASNIAAQIIAGETPTHARLGVSLHTVDKSVAKRNKLKVDSGAYVMSVLENTGAEEAGIEEGDIITVIDGKKVVSASDVTLTVRSHNPGETISLVLNRDGEEIEMEVKLVSDEE